MLRVEHIVTLREVLRSGSFAAAGNQLGYTASAVSQQVAALERELGVVLFERTARAAHPTEAAEVIARLGESLVNDAQALVTVARQMQQQSVPAVRLGCFPSGADLLVPDVLEQLAPQERTALRLHVGESTELLGRLGAAGDLAGAIVYQMGESGLSWPVSLSRRWLGEDPYVVAYPARWGTTPEAPYPIEAFSSVPWIFNVPPSSDATLVDAVFSRMGVHPHVVARSDDYDVTLRLVSAGFGAAPVPRVCVLRGVPDGVELLAPAWLNVSRSIVALWRPDAASTILDHCFREIRDRLDHLNDEQLGWSGP